MKMLNFPFVCRLCLIPSESNVCYEIFDSLNEIPVKIYELTKIQGVWCAPADSSSVSSDSYGSKLANDFGKNMGVVLGNLHNGVASLATPSIKFGVDTIPSLISYGINTAANKASKLVEAQKEALGKVSMGVGHAIGGGSVLGSSLAGGAFQVLGKGVEAGTNVAQSAAKASIDMVAKVADRASFNAVLGGNITNAALTAFGDGMTAAGGGVSVVSHGLASVIDAIGERIASRIAKAKETAAVLMTVKEKNVENGALSATSKIQMTFYKLLSSYLQILVNVQNLFDGLTSAIRPETTALAVEVTVPAEGTKTSSIS